VQIFIRQFLQTFWRYVADGIGSGVEKFFIQAV
jgi:hypothetical protein